jgi:hypothetical protein
MEQRLGIDKNKRQETRTFWRKRVPQALPGTTGEAAGWRVSSDYCVAEALGGLVVTRKPPTPNCPKSFKVLLHTSPKLCNIQAVPLFKSGALT